MVKSNHIEKLFFNEKNLITALDFLISLYQVFYRINCYHFTPIELVTLKKKKLSSNTAKLWLK